MKGINNETVRKKEEKRPQFPNGQTTTGQTAASENCTTFPPGVGAGGDSSELH